MEEGERRTKKERSTFLVLGGQDDGTKVVVFDQSLDLVINSGTIKAHHKELAHLPVDRSWLVMRFIMFLFLQYVITDILIGEKKNPGNANGSRSKSETARSYLSRSSQPGGSASSLGAMTIGSTGATVG